MEAAIVRYKKAKEDGTLDEKYPVIGHVKDFLTPTTEEDIIAEFEKRWDNNVTDRLGSYVPYSEDSDIKDVSDEVKAWLRTALHRHRISVIEEVLGAIPHKEGCLEDLCVCDSGRRRIRTTLQDMKDKK